jgi:hypothetical protein
MKYKTTAELRKKLKELGLPSHYRTIYRRIKTGKLVLPKDPMTGQYLIPENEFEDIIKAFSPGGEGHYESKIK